MKTTLEELRNNNIGYTLGTEGITEADLCLVNGNTRTPSAATTRTRS